MTEPTPGPDRTPDSLSDVERATRIEQLLVSGLDEYFAGRLDQAINVWTRVLFLDRANDRARAYIDRARRAQAERQRETEALVDQGLQAFDAGDVEQARRLLTSALEHGAPHEQTLPMLHRIGLLASPSPVTPAPRRARWRRAPRPATVPARFAWRWLVALLLLLLATTAAGVWIVVSAPGDGPAGSTPIIDPAAAILPLPGASEAYLVRAPVYCSPPGACPMRSPPWSGSRPAIGRTPRRRSCADGCSRNCCAPPAWACPAGGDRTRP